MQMRVGVGVGVGGRCYHSRLAGVVPNCLVAFYHTRNESSVIFCYPKPAGVFMP